MRKNRLHMGQKAEIVTTSLKSATTRNIKSSQLLYRITKPKESVISFYSILSDFYDKG